MGAGTSKAVVEGTAKAGDPGPATATKFSKASSRLDTLGSGLLPDKHASKSRRESGIPITRSLEGAPDVVALEKLPWPGARVAARVADIAHSARRAHYNAMRCRALAQACCGALAAVVDACPAIALSDPVGYTRVMTALLEALESVAIYVHPWSSPGWLKVALDTPPKAVTAAFEAECARLDLAAALEVPLSEALKLKLSDEGSALGALLPGIVELGKEAAALGQEDRLASDWQHVQSMWAAVDASGFAGAEELARLASLLAVGEATLSEEVAAAQQQHGYAAGSSSTAGTGRQQLRQYTPEVVISHPGMRAFWGRSFEAEKVTWEAFWEAFPAKLAEELEADPEGPLGLGGLMGDPETAAPMRDAMQAFVGPGRGVGISVLDVNALFPAGTRIGERVAELAAAAQQPHGMARLAGLQRVAAMPSDPDGLFVGRDQARADLQRLLGAEHRHGSVRTIFLTGPSGVGKSALARTLAKDCLHEKAWATAYYVDLGGCHTMAEAAQRMCAAFQVPREEVFAASGSVLRSQGEHGRLLMWLKAWSEASMGKGRALTGLVLDNAEGLFMPPPPATPDDPAKKPEVDGCEPGVELWALLSRMHSLASSLRTMVVSDRVGELPDAATNYTIARVGPLEMAPARELLVAVAPSLGHEDPKIADSLVAECGGLPAALRTVAATVANGSAKPTELLAALSASGASDAASAVAICLQAAQQQPAGATWLARALPLTMLPGTFTADAATAVLNAALPPPIDAQAASSRRCQAVAMLRQLAVRGLLQEADAMNGQQRWRMLPAVRRAVENILRPGSGGNSGSSDTSGPEWPALVHLLASSTAAAHRLFHDRAAGWVGAALFEAVAPLAAPIAAWLATPGSMPNSVRNELLQVVECRSLLAVELPLRLHRDLAEGVLVVVGGGRAKVGAAWALSRERGALGAALALATQGAAAVADAEGEDSVAHADALVVVGDLAAAAGDLARAEEAYQRCLMLRERLLGPHHSATARCQNNLGSLHARAYRWKDAELAFRSSLHAFQELLGESSLEAAMSMSNLGQVMFQQSELEEAEALYHSAMAAEQRCLAPDAPPFLTLVANLVELLEKQQRFEDADRIGRQILEALPWGTRPEEQELQYALDKVTAASRETAGHTTLELAAQMKLLKQEDGGEAAVEAEFEAIKQQVRSGGPSLLPFNERAAVAADVHTSVDDLDHTFKVDPDMRRAAMVKLAERQVADKVAAVGRDAPELLPLLQELGRLQHEAADFEAAAETCKRVQALTAQLCGPLSAETAAAANNFAVQLHCLGQYGAARPMYRRALQIWQKQSDGFEFHTEVVDVLCNLSRVSRACGDLDQAQAHLKAAIEKELALKTTQTPDVVAMKLRLAEMLEEDRKDYEVEQLLQTTVDEAQEQLGADHWEVAVLYGQLAAFFARKRRFPKYEHAAKMASESRVASAAASHAQVADRLQSIASAPCLQAVSFDPEPLLRVALHLRESAGPRAGGGFGSLAKTLNQLGNALKDKGQYADAEPCFRRALEALEKVAFPDPYQLANAAKNLADMLDLQGKLEEAEQLYWRFLENRETQLGAGAVAGSVPDSIANLAFLLRGAASKPDWVVSLLDKSASSAAVLPGGVPKGLQRGMSTDAGGWETGGKMDSGNIAELLIAIGSVLEHNRMAPQAETLYRAALAIRQLGGRGERAEGAAAVSALGVCVLGQGRLKEADKLLRSALSLRAKAYGKDHWLVATALNNLGTLLTRRERWEEAEKAIRQALHLRIHTPGIGPYHALVSATLKNLATLLHARGDWAAAEPLYQRALDIVSSVHGPSSQEAAQILNNLGVLMELQRNFKGADNMLTRCLEIRKSAGEGADSPYAAQIAATLCNIGHMRVSQDDLPGAEDALLEALRIYEGGAGCGHEADWATSMHNYSVLLRRQGRWKEAEPICRSVVEMRKSVLGEEHSQVGEALSILAGITQKKGRNLEAEGMYRSAVALMEKRPPSEDLAYALRGLARLHARKNDFAAAQATYTRCLRTWEVLGLGQRHPVVQVTLLEMAKTMQMQMEAENEAAPSKLKIKYGLRSTEKVWEKPGAEVGGASKFANMAKSFRRIVRPSQPGE